MQNDMLTSHSPEKHVKRFIYAGRGLIHIFKTEANFRVHVAATFLACILAYLFGFTRIEWLILIFTVGFVLIMETLNSLIEAVVDHLIKEHHEGARLIKDMGAACVLMSAITSVLVGILLYGPKLLVFL